MLVKYSATELHHALAVEMHFKVKWLLSVIPALGKLKQEGCCEFMAVTNCIVSFKPACTGCRLKYCLNTPPHTQRQLQKLVNSSLLGCWRGRHSVLVRVYFFNSITNTKILCAHDWFCWMPQVKGVNLSTCEVCRTCLHCYSILEFFDHTWSLRDICFFCTHWACETCFHCTREACRAYFFHCYSILGFFALKTWLSHLSTAFLSSTLILDLSSFAHGHLNENSTF